MRLFAFLHRRFHWINLPGALLMVLLQRTPVLSLFASAEEVLGAGTAGVVLKSGLATLAALGAVNTLVGATPLVPSSGTAAGISVTGSPVSVFYTVNGTQTPPMSWEVNGSIPPGLDFSGLTIPGTVNVGSLHLEGTPTANGTYNVTLQTFQLTNGGGFGSPIYAYTITVTGVSATSPPSFTTQPASQTVTAGTSVTFTAAASGTPAPAYQWQKGGVNIAGATNSSYSIASAAAGDAGSYTVVATNSAGTATSNAATLTVSAASSAPSFTTQPASKSVAVGSAVTFTAAASGNPTPTYQWQKDGAAIAGATNSSYSIASAAAGDAGSYTVVATNSVGTATSNTATLSLTAAAPTTVNGVTATVGHNASFSTGHVTGSIQWQVSTNGGSSWSNLGNDSTYAGATTSLLTVTSVTTAMNGAQYRYVLTTNGVVATSNGAALAVAQAFFPFPTGIAVDPAGNLYVSDANADTVQKVNPSGQVSLLAGASGATGTADGMGAAAKFNQPAGVMLLPAGAIVVTTAPTRPCAASRPTAP
jgi:plastocyanin